MATLIIEINCKGTPAAMLIPFQAIIANEMKNKMSGMGKNLEVKTRVID